MRKISSGAIAFFTALMCIPLTSCEKPLKERDIEVPKGNSEVTVDFLKVGKADAAVIRTREHTVVIDCGEKSDGGKVKDHLKGMGVEALDYLIISHYDKDHIGGAAKVLKKFGAEHVIAPEYVESSKEFEKLCEAMELQDAVFEFPEDVMNFTLDDVEFRILTPAPSYYSDKDNNRSLIVWMRHHQNTFLFTGDAEEERLEEIMTIGDCDVLKEPSHGRDIANLGKFLDKTTPEYAIISTDAENLSPKVEKLLSDRSIETYVTFRDGNIRCVSDGTKLEFTTNAGKIDIS